MTPKSFIYTNKTIYYTEINLSILHQLNLLIFLKNGVIFIMGGDFMKNLSSKQLKEISGGGRIAESIGYGIGIGLACIGDSKCAARKLNKLSNKK